MKKAVVFCGPVRGELLASKSWHTFGEADYFLITWDEFYQHTFPVPLQATITNSFTNFKTLWPNISEARINQAGMLHNWSLVETLPNIASYDAIVITRPDLFVFKKSDEFDYQTDVILMQGVADKTMNDQIVVLPPSLLFVMTKLYKAYTDINGEQTHKFLPKFAKDNPEYFSTVDKFYTAFDHELVRPTYPRHLESLPFGRDLFMGISETAIDWWKFDHDPAFASAEDERNYWLNDCLTRSIFLEGPQNETQ